MAQLDFNRAIFTPGAQQRPQQLEAALEPEGIFSAGTKRVAKGIGGEILALSALALAKKLLWSKSTDTE